MSRQKVSTRKVEEINDFLDNELNSLKDGSVSHSLDRRSNKSRSGISNRSYERLPKPADTISKKLDNLEERLLQTQQLVADRQLPMYSTVPSYIDQGRNVGQLGESNYGSKVGLSSALSGSGFGFTGIETYPTVAASREPQKLDLILQRLNNLEKGVSKVSKQTRRKKSSTSRSNVFALDDYQHWVDPMEMVVNENLPRHNRSMSKASSSGHSLGMPNSGSRRRAFPTTTGPNPTGTARVTAIGLTPIGTIIPNTNTNPNNTSNLATLLTTQLQTQLAQNQAEKDKVCELKTLNKTLKGKIRQLTAKLSAYGQLEADYATLMSSFERSEAVRKEQDRVIRGLKAQLKLLRK
jgi:hypothetical protein